MLYQPLLLPPSPDLLCLTRCRIEADVGWALLHEGRKPVGMRRLMTGQDAKRRRDRAVPHGRPDTPAVRCRRESRGPEVARPGVISGPRDQSIHGAVRLVG